MTSQGLGSVRASLCHCPALMGSASGARCFSTSWRNAVTDARLSSVRPDRVSA